MIETQYLAPLRKIYSCLKDGKAIWVITGSLGMALQGIGLELHDIDIQTDRQGAIDGMQIPVLSLEYEYQAYLKFGRVERAEILRKWLQNQVEKVDETK